MNIEDTLVLEEQIIAAYAETEQDVEIIKALCFACNIAEIVQVHFQNSSSKLDFYAKVLGDVRISYSYGYQTLSKYYTLR